MLKVAVVFVVVTGVFIVKHVVYQDGDWFWDIFMLALLVVLISAALIAKLLAQKLENTGNDMDGYVLKHRAMVALFIVACTAMGAICANFVIGMSLNPGIKLSIGVAIGAALGIACGIAISVTKLK